MTKKRMQLGQLSLRQSSRPREFKAIKTVQEKIQEAKENKLLMDEWIATPGNNIYIGEHGPKQKDKRYYSPVGSKGKLY